MNVKAGITAVYFLLQSCNVSECMLLTRAQNYDCMNTHAYYAPCTSMCIYTEEVIPGWEIAVKSMYRNECSQFLISSQYAFGKMGCPPRIPPNATSEIKT